MYIQKNNEERTKMQEDTYEAEYLNLKREYDLKYNQLYQEVQNIVSGTTGLPVINDLEFDKYDCETIHFNYIMQQLYVTLRKQLQTHIIQRCNLNVSI